jgi:hypothetical protein
MVTFEILEKSEIAKEENLPIPPLPPSAKTLILFCYSQLGFLFSKKAAIPSNTKLPKLLHNYIHEKKNSKY